MLLLVLFSLGTNSFTQVSFDSLYNYSNFNDRGEKIILTQDGNYLIGANIGLIKITPLGDTLWTKQYSSINLNSVIETNGGDFIIAGSVTDSITEGAIMKVNSLGDSLWLKKYGIEDLNIFFDVKQTANNEIVAVGESFTSTDTTRVNAWIIKTDSSGNLLWEKQFNNLNKNDLFISVLINLDFTITCGGISIDSISRRGYIVKLKANGDAIWTKYYINGVKDINSINSTQDNNYVIASAKIINGLEKAYISKIDTSGSIIWEKSYARDTNNYKFTTVIELSDSNFIAGGNDYDFSQNPVKERVRLMVLNNNGDSLWSEQYTHYGGVTQDYITDMKPTANGGAIFCGYVRPGTFPNFQDIWVVKTDSIDCANFVGGCNIVGVKDASTSLSITKIIVYPNPNNGIFTIEFANFENAVVEIYNIAGQLVKQTTLQIIDISKQPNGLYLLKISSNNQVVTKRIVKQ